MLREKSHKTWFLLALLTFASCAANRPLPSSPEENPEVMGPVIPDSHVEEQQMPSEIYGPEVPAATGATSIQPHSTDAGGASSSTTGPEGPSVGTQATAPTVAAGGADSAKLCIVLGPGMAKAMAEAAVLDAIRKAKLPVHCIVGTEMGAVVGALYSHAGGNANNLLWQLFKLNKDNYLNFPMLSLREPKSSGSRLNEFFRGIFRDLRIEQMPIHFATSAVDDEGDVTVEFDRGDLANALSASVAIPGIFDSWKFGRVAYRSSAVTDPAPLELARKLGGNFIVLVDVLLEGDGGGKSRYHRAFSAARSLIKLQKKEASFVIQVNTGAIAFDDFNRKGEILAAGSAAAEKSILELKAAWEKWLAGSH